MSYPVTLAVTTGRSGSTFLADSFQRSAGDRGRFYHERVHPGISKPAQLIWRTDTAVYRKVLAHPVVQSVFEDFDARSERGPVVDFGFTMTGLIPAFFERYGSRLRVLVLHRHPASVAASFAIRGHYTRYLNPAWAISPMHENARYRHYAAEWPSWSRFEKCLYRWLEITAYGLELPKLLPGIRLLTMSSDSVFGDPDALERVAKFVGLEGVDIERSKRTNASERHYLERWPVGDEWARFSRVPEVLDVAGCLGYDCSHEAVFRRIAPYQLPQNLGSMLRNRLQYWAWRERVGGWKDEILRRRRIDPPLRQGPGL